MKVLVTGGAGYIGSHTTIELLEAGYDIVIVDNYSNSDRGVLDRVMQIVNSNLYETRGGTNSKTLNRSGKIIDIIEGDVGNYESMCSVFEKHEIGAVIHFAGYKAVGESVEKPLMYYRNNLNATMNLASVMNKYDVNKIIFSSSATVYGMNNIAPFDEDMPTSCTNPYGWTKLMSEQILKDAAIANPKLSVALLRYFNPVGAHPSGLIGEDPKGIPNNLMPYIQQVAAGTLDHLTVFGNDYDTPDGSGVRDYIHVVDLAKGHLKALRWLTNQDSTLEIFNLGTGQGTSVIELAEAFARVNKVGVPYEIGERRAGDIDTCYADAAKAERILGWKASKGIDEMCEDAWRWEKKK